MHVYQKEKGQSIVEWAIILPFLLLVLLAIIELAPLMNGFLKVEKAAQYGARIGAIHGSTNEEIFDAVLFNLQGMTNRGNFTGGERNLPNQSTSSYVYEETYGGRTRTVIEITPGKMDYRINGGWIMVRITYYYEIFTPLLRGVFGLDGTILENGKYFPITRYAIYRIE